MQTPDVHYCKHCDTSFAITVPSFYTGDAIIKYECGWDHPRQFEFGIAVSCDLPTGKAITIRKKLPIDYM